MKFVVAGSVSTSTVALEALLRNGATVVGVLGLHPALAKNVSGYVDLSATATANGIPYVAFRQINSAEVLVALRRWQPDHLFVVGLSQLVSEEVMRSASKSCIGFHPTLLPSGRGRAPLAWLVLDRAPAAATLFQMTAEADAGPIIAQVRYDVRENDYAVDVLARMEDALARALDETVPRLLAGESGFPAQCEQNASWYGKRTPKDGCIHWDNSAEEICALVRATSHPHPGAYTFLQDTRMVIWRASVERSRQIKGVVGRVVLITEHNHLVVQSGQGLVRIEEYDIEGSAAGQEAGPAVGSLLGYSTENELFELRRRIAILEELVRRGQ